MNLDKNHPDLYSTESRNNEKLLDYSVYIPVVELDTAFSAVHSLNS